MNRKKLQETCLNYIRDVLSEDESIQVLIQELPINGEVVPVLSALHEEFGQNLDEALIECSFPAVDRTVPDISFFMVLITIADDVAPERIQVISEAIAVLNFCLPCGCFALKPGGQLLCYRLTVPLSEWLTEEAFQKEAFVSLAQAMKISEQYIAVLLDLLYGTITLEEFYSFLPVK